MSRRTKIVATLGPASDSVEVMTELIEAGADVFRLNFSHSTRDEHARVVAGAREASERAGREVGLLGDLPGPKLRLGELTGGMVELEQGERVTVTSASGPGGEGRLPVSWQGLPAAVKPGEPIFLADGRVRLNVIKSSGEDVECEVEVGGPVVSHQGMNLPGTEIPLPAAGEDDMNWVAFAVEQGIDLLAVSFVRTAADVESVEKRLDALDSDIPVIAKIERPQAAEDETAEAIVRASFGGIMVARGDLGIELPLAAVPGVQRKLLAIAGRHSRGSITATQMLASMVRSPRPTRAEVSDVAGAIYQGTDAVMLSEETAIGEHAVEAVRVMDEIARETEIDLPYGEWVFERAASEEGDVAGSVARAAVGSTYTLGLTALVVPTRSGRTARLVSAHRPKVPVLAVSPQIETVRRLSILFGVKPMLSEDWTSLRALLDQCATLAREAGVAESGQLIGITAGLPSQEMGTNLFEVHRVP